MIGKSSLAILTAWAVFLPAGRVSAEDKGKEKTLQPRADVKAEKTAASGTLPSKSLSAATVDFQAELGLSFPSLLSIGARIERYRTSSPDPFGLANAARELAAAEKFTGRNASITAEQLMQEAVQMAKVRNDATELKATASLVSDKKIREELIIAAERADKGLGDLGAVGRRIDQRPRLLGTVAELDQAVMGHGAILVGWGRRR